MTLPSLLICLTVSLCSLTQQKGLEVLNSSSIYSVTQSEDGAIWLNSNFGVYRFNGRELKFVHEPLMRFRFSRTDEGLLLHRPGRDSGFRIDTRTLSFSEDSSEVAQEVHGDYPWKDVRAVAEDRDGKLYVGTSEGLFRISTDGSIDEIPIRGIYGSPICDAMTDRDGNLWIGTFYDGLFYCNLSSNPFTTLPKSDGMHKMKGAVQTPDGSIWVVTDGYGMFCRTPSDGSWKIISGTEHIKFQGAWYDRRTRAIWAGEFTGALIRFSLDSRKLTRIPFADGKGHSVTSICRIGDDIILGGGNGVMRFNPEAEISVSRHIEGIDNFVNDLATDAEGNLWAGSGSLYRYSADGSIDLIRTPAHSITDMEFDSEGTLWAAGASSGVIRIQKDGAVKTFRTENSDLHDNFVTGVSPLSGGLVLVCTRSGVEILNPETGASSHFASGGGFKAVSTDKAAKLITSDGKLIIFGSEGIESLDETMITPIPPRNLSFDGIFDERLVIKPGNRNFSIRLTDFDYTGIEAVTYSYMMDGLDREWKEFDLSQPLNFMNMKPGRYKLSVKGESGGEMVCSASLKIRMQPKWYESLAARICFILLGLALFIGLVSNSYGRALMSEKLKMKERENEGRVRQFHNISLQLRTPINLTLTELEQFFREHGSHTRGIETLDDVYARMKRMHGLIAEYVEDQEVIEPQIILKYERFLSAATGVVERNLFSENLNVTTLCTELNMGKSKLSEMMKAASGMSPREFIEDIRLRHAEQMLESGTYRVGEVAERLGFGSAKYFSQRYNKKFGHPPKKRIHP